MTVVKNFVLVFVKLWLMEKEEEKKEEEEEEEEKDE